ncbi:hypothetical protein FNT36_14220 [Hymenobacter setariae]|uniref:Uncharacterized protein n=1 Tax=Hymenobacter setariae TaxID=2594794 RepID=A0A558BVV8_9BACT|nr:hypothetical protein [Hymenobacter setariae]TVT40621.1 hypothetical protein FNT36_14220 [Hymenobacter setariae]
MKRYLLLLALPAVACHSDQPTTSGQPAASATPAGQAPASTTPTATAFTPPTGSLRSGDTKHPTDHDTLHVLGGGVLYLKPSTAAAFARAPTELDWDADKRLTTNGSVRRVGNDLLLQPKSGPVVKFTTRRTTMSSSGEDIDKAAESRYLGQLTKAYVWVVLTDSSTKHVTTLIDQRTGHCTIVTGNQPTVSPDGQYLLSTRSDQGNDGSDESTVGTQLYELTSTGPRLLWTRLTLQWGSNEARWLGPRTVLLKQEYEAADQESAPPPETYVQVELPR